MSEGIQERAIDQTSFAVIDFETTGLSPGTDRVIEISILRADPGKPPRLVLDTLINPRRPVAATEIHGITDQDVADAPTFRDIAGDAGRAIAGSVVAAYNVYFDMPFLQFELSQADMNCAVPNMCLMYLRPMLGLGSKCSLADACQQLGINHEHAHMASVDAFAAASLLSLYLQKMNERRLRTFGELAKLKSYKFIESFARLPFSESQAAGHPRCTRLKSRMSDTASTLPSAAAPVPSPARNPLGEYWDALAAILADLTVTAQEATYLLKKKQELALSNGQIRAIHARMFAKVISQFTDDRVLDDGECENLQRVHSCLRQLGWAPGDL